MSSQLKIVNDALRAIGQPPIDSIDDANAYAKHILDAYQETLTRLISELDWSFCLRSAVLVRRVAPLDGTPADPPLELPGFEYSYEIPNGAITSSLELFEGPEYEDSRIDPDRSALDGGYKVERGVLYANEESVFAKYKLVPVAGTDEPIFTAEFSRYLSLTLARESLYAIVADKDVETRLERMLFGSRQTGDVGARAAAISNERRKNPQKVVRRYPLRDPRIIGSDDPFISININNENTNTNTNNNNNDNSEDL